MAVRELKTVEAYVRGKWIKTKAWVIPSDICLYPLCIRKIPSLTSKARNSKTKIPKGYCSFACKKKHDKGEHKIRKLDEFV